MRNIVIWIIIEIALIILVAVIYVVFQYALITDRPDGYINYSDDLVETGDVIVSSFGHLPGVIMCGSYSSAWGHSSIILTENSRVYVLDAGIYGGKFNGASKIPINIWCKIHKNDAIIGLLKLRRCDGKDPNISECKLGKIYDKFKDVKLDGFSPTWIRFAQKNKFQHGKIRPRLTCHEVTIHVLKEMGIYKKDYECGAYSPACIANRNICCKLPYYYDKLIGLKLENFRMVYNSNCSPPLTK